MGPNVFEWVRMCLNAFERVRMALNEFEWAQNVFEWKDFLACPFPSPGKMIFQEGEKSFPRMRMHRATFAK